MANMDKYIKLKHFQTLMKLIEQRDGFEWWMVQYDKYDKKVNNTIEWLELNAKTKEEL